MIRRGMRAMARHAAQEATDALGMGLRPTVAALVVLAASERFGWAR